MRGPVTRIGAALCVCAFALACKGMASAAPSDAGDAALLSDSGGIAPDSLPGIDDAAADSGDDARTPAAGDTAADTPTGCAAHATRDACRADPSCWVVLGMNHSGLDAGAACWTDRAPGVPAFVECIAVPAPGPGHAPVPQGWTYAIAPGTTECFSIPIYDTSPALPSCESTLPRCSGDPAPVAGACGFTYTDTLCTSDGTCRAVGDGSCYQECSVSSDCKDPSKAHCSTLCLYAGGDTPSKPVRVCRERVLNDCP